jgi:hypothetical protein
VVAVDSVSGAVGDPHLAKRMLIDPLACAPGWYPRVPSRIARDLAATVTSTQPCTVIGSG